MSRLLLTSPVASVECVPMSIPLRMSPADQARFDLEWKAKMADISTFELTAGQQLALMETRRSELCREVVEKLRSSTVRASAADHDALVRKGLAIRRGQKLV